LDVAHTSRKGARVEEDRCGQEEGFISNRNSGARNRRVLNETARSGAASIDCPQTRIAVHSLTPSTPGTVLCPICRRPLTLPPDRWLATFEGDRWGRLLDFDTAALSPRKVPATLTGLAGPDDAFRRP